ncbi:MAG: four helix bundle protein [Candidatus Omnitrophica bacterium]|nr:four helix bundle protein [Candidatus Omnitrophota bacterium]
MIKDFRDLDVWRNGMEIVRNIYEVTESFPKREEYGLTSQMCRAAVSIPSNIAEGFNRRHNKEYRQLLYVVLGSCAELETQCEIAFTLRYLEAGKKEVFLELLQHESKMLTNLIRCLK